MLYSSRTLYHLTMRLLYGRYYQDRYRVLAAEVPENSVVVDVCSGDCYLHLKYLREKSVRYLGLDASPQLVRWAQKHGVRARKFDLWEEKIPAGDIILMQASLYQFLPHAESIVRRLIQAARKKVLISEPIRNLACSSSRLLSLLGQRLTVPASARSDYSSQRFDRESLMAFFGSFDEFQHSAIIPGGREMLGIFRGGGSH